MFKKSICCMILLIAMLISSCAQDEMHYPETETPSPSNFTIEIPSYIESDDAPIYHYGRMEKEHYQYQDGCFYFYINGQGALNLSRHNKSNTLLRMNIRNGTITTVCPDPLCMHNTPECPFAGRMFNVSIDGDMIIYARRYIYRDDSTTKNDSVIQICSYNLSDMKMKVHREIIMPETNKGAFKSSMLYHNEYIYLYDMIYNEEDNTYQQGIYRINTSNNKQEIIINPQTNNTTTFLFILNDRIYFTDINTIYSVNLDIEDKQIHAEGTFSTARIYTDGQYIYYALAGKDSTDNLYRMNLDGTNVIDLGINTDPSWFLTEKYIYYFPHDKMNIPNPNGQTALLSMCNTIWRCDHDGSNKTKVVELERSEKGFIQIHDVQVIGNYAYTDYYEYVDKNESGFFESDQDRLYYSVNDPTNPHILRIDLTTGEMIKLYIPDV